MTPTLTREESLLATDRCDRCGAQAYVRVTLDGGSALLFCAHHYRAHEERLRSVAVDILDQTAKLADGVAIPEA